MTQRIETGQHTAPAAAILAAMGRKTEQANTLREARDELAQHARSLAQAKDRRGLERMGLSPERAGEILRGEPFTSQDMADLLGVSLVTLRGWLAPKTSKIHREMPLTARLLLARILADRRRK